MKTVVKILSYNIHKGFNTSNQQYVLGLIKDAIRDTGAEIAFLQEIVGDNKKFAKKIIEWPSNSQFEFMADGIWTYYAYGKNAVYREEQGHHGNAILSAFPIVSWSNSNISIGRFEQRGLLHAKIEIPYNNETIDCYCVHLSLFQKSRKKQLSKIIEIIAKQVEKNRPFIIAGDFNDWSQKVSEVFEKELGVFEVFKSTNGEYAGTYPAFAPLLKLDRIYIRGFSVKNQQILTGRPWSNLSDHLAIYAELVMDNGEY